MPSLTGTFDWTRLEGTIVVPEGAERAELAAALDGSGQVWFDDFWVTAVGPADSMERRRRPPASIRGGSLPVEGGLFLVRSEECISRATSRSAAVEWPMTLALPLCDRDQVPVAYDVWTEPASAFVSARIREDRPGQHVADLRLQLAPGADSLILRWNSVVLVAPRSFVDVPERAPMPAAWPAEAGAWLRASRCAEARDVQIQSLAAGIRLGSQDLLEIVHRTLAEVRDVRRTRQGAAVTFNSVEALTREGSCLSDVHLVTALLRANGIPARIVSGLPTLGRPTSVHFIAEAWIPGAGWYPLEPTVGFAPWPRSEFVRLAIVPVDYEDRGAIRASGEGSPCLPYLAVSEAPLAENGLATFGLVDRAHGVPRAVEGIRRFGAGRNPASWIPVIEVASAQWHAWLSSGPALDANHHFATARTAGDWRTGEPLRDLLRAVADP